MTDADPNWIRLKEAVADALDAPTEQRRAVIERELGDDPELAAQAHALVEASQDDDPDSSAEGLHPELDTWILPASGAASASPRASMSGRGPDGTVAANRSLDPYALVGQRVDRYTVRSLIAMGGMGAVYVADQAEPKRQVALKVLRPDILPGTARERFRREVVALGRLKHPGVAQVYDAGVHQPPTGMPIPYIVMEYVDGKPLTDHARSKNLSVDQRVALMAQVADAVHAAHQQAIVHRDLKPANVMATSDGTVKVLDFGVARLTDDEMNQSQHTASDVLLGTLAYMSPEQLAGSGVDVRSDVYALGVMLFELIEGKTPIDVRGKSLPVALHALMQQEDRTEVDRTIALDVRTIIDKTLQKSPDDRYGSAAALADDLRRYLANEPILAHPPTRVYVMKKFARRHRGALVSTIVFLTLLTGFAIAAAVGFVQASQQRDNAVTAREDADQQREDAEEARDDAIVAREEAAAQRDAADRAKADAEYRREIAVASEQRALDAYEFFKAMVVSPEPGHLGQDVTLREAMDLFAPEIDASFPSDPTLRADLHGTFGWSYYLLADYARAEMHIRQAIALHQEVRAATLADPDPSFDSSLDSNLDPNLDPEVDPAEPSSNPYLGELTNQAYLLNLLRWDGRFDEAQSLLGEVLPIATRELGRNDPTTLTIREHQAGLAVEIGQTSRAIKLYAALTRDARATLPEDDKQLFTFAHNYGNALVFDGRYAEARAVLEPMLMERIDVLGADHVDVARTRQVLAVCFTEDGAYGVAERMLRESYDVLVEKLGPDHPDTLSTMDTRATALFALGQREEALALSREVYRLTVARLGEGHPDSLRLANNLVVSLMQAGAPEEALPLAESTAAATREAHGPRSPNALQADQTLASAYEAAGRIDEARALFQGGIEALREMFGIDAWQTVYAENNLAMLDLNHGNPADALVAFEALLARTRAVQSVPTVAILLRNTGRAAMATGDLDRAEALLLESFDLVEHEPGGAARSRTSEFLIELYEQREDESNAERFRAFLLTD